MDLVSRFVLAALATSLIIGAGSSNVVAQGLGATVWTANPTRVVQGGAETDVILSAPPAACGTGAGQLNDSYLDNNTVKPTVMAQAGFSVSVGTPTHSKGQPCELTVPLTPAANAMTGPMRLTLTAANAAGTAQPIGIATITITSSQAGPIPDGLSQQVDADYVVLPFETASDNYGTRVAQQFFVIIPTIGNNTGFSLQLSRIGFAGTPTGNTDPAIVQGTLLYGEDYSARNNIYRFLVSASLLAAGASPFFHEANPKANFAAVAALIGGPLLGSFSQEFPDNTVKQLARLGASDVMTNQNIIPNNSQASFVAFVGRETLCPPKGARWPRPAGFTAAELKGVCGSGRYQKDAYDPDIVKSKLGAITIVGNLLPSFLARIKVTSSTASTPPASGTASGPALEGVYTPIFLQSTGLTGASMTSSPSSITSLNVITDSSFEISALVLSKPSAPLTVILTRKDGSTVTFPISVTQPVEVVTLPGGAQTLPLNVATPVTVSWQNNGPVLTSVTPTVTGATFTGATWPNAGTINGSITPTAAGTVTVSLPITVGGTPITDISAATVVAK